MSATFIKELIAETIDALGRIYPSFGCTPLRPTPEWTSGDILSGELPDPFLDSLFPQSADWDPIALCAGFDGGDFREKELARHLTEWILEFALRRSERALIPEGKVVSVVRHAASRVFQKDSESRGEAGELLLHAACRQEFGTEQLIARLFYKSSLDQQIHGFDCVHFREGNLGQIELWLGESKLYTSASGAISAARSSIKEHLVFVVTEAQ